LLGRTKKGESHEVMMTDKITVKVIVDKEDDSILFNYLVKKSVRRRATFLRELATERLIGDNSIKKNVSDDSNQIETKEKTPERAQQSISQPQKEAEKVHKDQDINNLKKKKSDQLESKLGLFE